MKKILLFSGVLLICIAAWFFKGRASWEDQLKTRIKRDKPPVWALEQVRRDLAFFSGKRVTKQVLDEVMALDDGNRLFVRFQIQAKTVSMICHAMAYQNPHVLPVYHVLRKLAETVSLPEVDFILCMHDSFYDDDLPGPIFGFAKNPALQKKTILFPDYEALQGHVQALEQIASGKEKYPWKKKESRAFWRGATSGALFSAANFLELPRAKLVSLSLHSPNEVDARFTFVAQCTDPQNLGQTYPEFFSKGIQIKKHLQYKYQLLLDGNSCAYGRAYWQLFSECPIFKQESPYVQWYYGNLKPFEHYIPLRQDISDLIEKIQWAKTHDREVQQIAQNAYKFAQDHLNYVDILYYVYLVLTEYSKLQKCAF